VWQDVPAVGHVELGRWAQLVIVAPATADLVARIAAGLADDLLTTTLLTATCPVLLAPAMHTEMWLNPATQANVATVQERGMAVLPPAVGRLTGSDSGPGRLPEPEVIAGAALALLAPQDLAGRRVLVSAGGTREPVDPVRFLGNRSSGRQGVAIAQRARDRGAEVTLVAAHLDVDIPANIEVISVETAADMRRVMREQASDSDVIVMAAAVADFRPARIAEHKIKKSESDSTEGLDLVLERTEDVLAELVATRSPGQVIIGFAAETGSPEAEVVELGRHKLARKGCDLLVVNDVSGDKVFGRDTNEAVILDRTGSDVVVAKTTKVGLADTLWDTVAQRY
jgi:phosphopantothenoylcysteine decarboxylase/phosphopantothenate--cysteine ligase